MIPHVRVRCRTSLREHGMADPVGNSLSGSWTGQSVPNDNSKPATLWNSCQVSGGDVCLVRSVQVQSSDVRVYGVSVAHRCISSRRLVLLM